MTSSLKGADTNHEWMGDDAGELQCSSKSIRNSNMMTCDQSSSNYKTDSGYIAIQYVTKKGQMGKSELTHSFHLCSTIVFTDDEIMEVGVSQSNEIKKSKFKNQKKLDIKNILTDFFQHYNLFSNTFQHIYFTSDFLNPFKKFSNVGAIKYSTKISRTKKKVH